MSNGRKLNYEETQELAKSLGFALLEPKENFKTFNDCMLYKCLKCGAKENTRLRTIEKRKTKCKECYRKEKYSQGLLILKEKGYSTKADCFTNMEQEIEITCSHGHTYCTTWSYVFDDRGCRKCVNKQNGERQRRTNEDIKELIEKEGYFFTDELPYINNTTPIRLICPHGKYYDVALCNFTRGRRCTCERKSRGEQKIEVILKEFDLKFEREKRFPNCKDIYTLPFDFFIEELNVLIEFDGRQHYELAFNYNEQDLIDRKRKDEIKNNFCKHNNIKLIRIPYWEYEEIENILRKELLI